MAIDNPAEVAHTIFLKVCKKCYSKPLFSKLRYCYIGYVLNKMIENLDYVSMTIDATAIS